MTAPTGPAGNTPDGVDDALLAALRDTLAAVDPPPPDLAALGRAAFALRRLDDELAELVADSRAGAGVRDTTPAARLLAFTAGTVAVDVQLSARPDGDVDLLGEVDPPPPDATVMLEALTTGDRGTSDAGLPVELDTGGRFAVVVPADATVRLRITRPDVAPVTTPWFAVRPGP